MTRNPEWGCSCGHVARSSIAEARHRHNFPLLCLRPKVQRPRRDAPVKCCPQCYMIVYNGVQMCHGCGHEFYPTKVQK